MSIKFALSDQEITEVVTKLLQNNYANKGFKSAIAQSAINFEGEPIISVHANYKDSSISTDLLESSYLLENKLEELGEERSVFIYNHYDNEEKEEEEEEE